MGSKRLRAVVVIKRLPIGPYKTTLPSDGLLILYRVAMSVMYNKSHRAFDQLRCDPLYAYRQDERERLCPLLITCVVALKVHRGRSALLLTKERMVPTSFDEWRRTAAR